MTRSRRRRAARDAAVYGWRRSGRLGALERIGHSSWVAALLVQLLALVAVLVVAASWLVPAVTAGVASGWDTNLDGGPLRAASLSGPAWMYGLFGLAFLAIAVCGLPYVAREVRKDRRPNPILTLAPGFLTVQTVHDVSRGTGVRKPRLREAPIVLEWHEIAGVESSGDLEDERPILVVRRSAAADRGLPLDAAGDGDDVRIRFRGSARDVAVLSYFLHKRRRQQQLGSEESLRLAQQLSTTGLPAH
ncbi:hypothetical protein [Agromyces sp. NPDC056965]|uniref:hypothetical protein n=1 Tax=Agromyces sp. NPDC056965 TaxID=3345983 RepID=UPI00363A25D3